MNTELKECVPCPCARNIIGKQLIRMKFKYIHNQCEQEMEVIDLPKKRTLIVCHKCHKFIETIRLIVKCETCFKKTRLWVK